VIEQPTGEKQTTPSRDAYVATPPQPDPPLPPKYPAAFTDFKGLHRDILPFFSERALREAIRKGHIPSCVLGNGRKRCFHIPSVTAALLRKQKGGVL
jgi:hypothetical protein